MTEETKDLDISLLDMDIDSIEDLPGFEVPHNGEYMLQLKTTLKNIKGRTCVETSFEMLECIKKDNDSDPDTVAGSKFSSLYTVKGDGKNAEEDKEQVRKGLGYLKLLLADVAETTGQGNLMILIRDVVADCTVLGTVKRRVDAEDKEKVYGSVKNMRLA